MNSSSIFFVRKMNKNPIKAKNTFKNTTLILLFSSFYN
jgi:hypothetical protein